MSKLTKLNILNKDIRSIINKYLLPHKKSLDFEELEDSTKYLFIGINYINNCKFYNYEYRYFNNHWFVASKNNQ
jgi:hypothetical protein